MVSVKIRSRALLAFVCLGGTLSLAGEAWNEDRRQAYNEAMQRIALLSSADRLAGLSKEAKLENLAALERMGGQIEQQWREADIELYARLMRNLCGAIGSVDFGDSKRKRAIVTGFAFQVLERADRLPLDVEWDLVGFISPSVSERAKTMPEEAWANYRAKVARLWLHAWRRTQQGIDPNWDLEDVGANKVVPPPGTGLRAGVSPNSIADPRLRAEYEAAIEANRRKLEKCELQHELRDLMRQWGLLTERFLIDVYMKLPDRTAELSDLLNEYINDKAVRQETLDAVRARQIPDRLMFRINTRPAVEESTNQ